MYKKLNKIIAVMILAMFVFTNTSSAALNAGTLRIPLELKREELKPDLDSQTTYFLNILTAIEKVIDKNSFLKKTIPGNFIETIKSNAQQQSFTINMLSLYVQKYDWIINDYIKRKGVDKQVVLNEVQNDIYKPIIGCLVKISKRIQNDDLVPNAVSGLNLSMKDNFEPAVNIKREARLELLGMKGDPWHDGHVWMILNLLADGADFVSVMLDNSDPERKVNLTGLPIREADFKALLNAMQPFVGYTTVQREDKNLFAADAETIFPGLIYLRRKIAELIRNGYNAGFDHFNWLNTKHEYVQLDVPSKLCHVVTKLFNLGINAKINVRFHHREGDKVDDPEIMGKDRIFAMEATANRNIIEFLSESAGKLVEEKIGKGKDVASWQKISEEVNSWKERKIKDLESSLNVLQEKYYKEWFMQGRELLSDPSRSPDLKTWLDRLDLSMDSMKGMNSLQTLLDSKTESMQQEVINALNHHIKALHMSFEVVDQPMDASSTGVRERGENYAVPLSIVPTLEALQRYPAYIKSETVETDKKITTDILADLIDLDILSLDSSKGIRKGEIIAHLGKSLPDYVDIDVLLNKLNERLSKGQDKSAFLFVTNTAYDTALEKFQRLLSSAYGNALHAVDSYIVKCMNDKKFTDEFAAAREIPSVDLAIDKLDSLRDLLIKNRADEICVTARKSWNPTSLIERVKNIKKSGNEIGNKI
ncbi:MAG: hypothetical protein P9L93_05965 [Candidatus Gorgyraea atricola]|nr:hypothetical protein [Candidatus Gorgyraea atricola]